MYEKLKNFLRKVEKVQDCETITIHPPPMTLTSHFAVSLRELDNVAKTFLTIFYLFMLFFWKHVIADVAFVLSFLAE